MYRVLTLLLLAQQFAISVRSQCSPDILVEPCSCIENKSAGVGTIPIRPHSIVCDHIHISALSLRSIFLKLSVTNRRAHFNDFLLSSTHIDHLPSNLFGNITFSTIILYTNPLLKSIDIAAFDRTRQRVEVFKTFNTSLADSVTIFTIIRQFSNLRFLSMENDQLQSIPDEALNHTKLEYIWLGMPCTKTIQPIHTIGKNPFYNLPSLHSLRIFSPSLSTIGKHSMAMSQRTTSYANETNSWLHVYIGGPMLTGDSFEPTALTRFGNRPVLLRIYSTTIDYLDEQIFQPFLAVHSSSILTIEDSNISRTCDQRSSWISEQFCTNRNCSANRVYGTACFSSR